MRVKGEEKEGDHRWLTGFLAVTVNMREADGLSHSLTSQNWSKKMVHTIMWKSGQRWYDKCRVAVDDVPSPLQCMAIQIDEFLSSRSALERVDVRSVLILLYNSYRKVIHVLLTEC
jgi:hypothetical protein